MDIQIKSEPEATLEAEIIFQSIGEGAVVTDRLGRINRINQAGLDILGYKEEELIGKWFPDAIRAENENGELIRNIDRPIAEVFITGETISGRLYYQRKDGDRVPVSITVSPIIRDGRPVGAIEVFRDISTELALEKAKDEFVAIASHQLRTPATAVRQYIGLLLEGYAEVLKPNQREFLVRAHESNDRQLQIIDDLLQVARIDAVGFRLNLRRVDVTKLVAAVVNEMKKQAETKGQKLLYQPPAAKITAQADEVRLRMVIENLTDNALNYSSPGKTIMLRVRQTKNSVAIDVIDQGVGIQADDMPRLFKKFSRIPNSLSVQAGGSGLGLYWAARVAKLHGGRINVSSTPDKGSRFTVVLPRKLTRRSF